MRFSQDKIYSIAEKIVADLNADLEAEFLAPQQEVELAIVGAIAADLREEDEIDEEVDAMLQEYRHQIEIEGMDEGVLRRKIKSQVARKRGFQV